MENFVGIDLGTTNSAICTFDKDTQQTRVWRSPEGNDVTPSAIYIDRRGEYVGQRAYNDAPRSPDNCATLFKRFIGTTTPIELTAVDRTFTPEECSAKVLTTLFGYLPEEIRNSSDTGTVITVPAAFNQMQKNATMTAAEMAGIGKVELVQEPVSAVTSFMKASGGKDGIYLIYDLGGGTLDIAIAESIRKRVNILAHGGIQMCGGRDFDRTLVDNIVCPWLHENFDLPEDLSSDPTFKPLLRFATWATEKAKIELSARDEAMISLSEVEIRTNDLNGDEIYLHIPLDRNTFDKLIEDQITETIDAVRETLSKTGYTPNDIESIVWVGGPTHYKPLRDKVAFELGIKGDILTVNPMTAVAEGASIWAESVDWNSAKNKEGTKSGGTNVEDKSSDELEFTFNFKDRTPDDTTKIALQVRGQVPTGYQFEIISLDSGWTSRHISLRYGATIDVNLLELGENKFTCTVYDELGKTIKQEEIVIRKVDISMDKIPAELSIALEVVRKVGKEPELKYLVKKGDLLPKAGEITVYAEEALEAGSSNSLNFKLREIDSRGRNKPMGVLRIEGKDLTEGSIPVNTPLKLSYEKSRGGNVKFEIEVEIEGISRTFNDVLYYDEDSMLDTIQMEVNERLQRQEHILKANIGMDLLHNPFYFLKTTQRDDKKTIVKLAEEQGLLSDADKCRNVQDTLTFPRKRISAEIAWLHGIPTERVYDILILLESVSGDHINIDQSTSDPSQNSLALELSRIPYAESSTLADEVLELLISHEEHSSKINNLVEVSKFLGFDNLSPIDRANLLAARMLRLTEYSSDNVARWIIAIAQTFQEVNPSEVCRILNVERRESGFPEITDLSEIVSEIQSLRQYYKQVIKFVLENIDSAKERVHAVMMVVESVTDNESSDLPILIEDAIDSYEDVADSVLELGEKEIEKYDKKLRIAAEEEEPEITFARIVKEFIKTIKDWCIIAQPIQLNKKRQGLRHAASHNVSKRVRLLAIFLINEYDKLESSQKILKTLKEVFTEFPEITERITADLETLNKITQQREDNSQISLFDN